MSIKNNLLKFFRGFKFAFCGIMSCVKTERNMRFHIGAAVYVLFFMRFFDLTRGERALIYIAIALVIAMEAVNTAVENTVDLLCKGQKNPFAKLAKDAAAGGVLAVSAGAAAVGVTLFWDKVGFIAVKDYFEHNIWALFVFMISVVLWILWILRKH